MKIVYKNILVALVLLGISVQLNAQKDAKEIMDKASRMYKDAGGISASFTMNVKEVKNKVTYSFDGNIEMKQSKYHFITPENECWFDGKTQWTYLKDSEEVNVTEPGTEEVQMMNPIVIFELYKKGANLKYLGAKNDIKQRKVYEIELKTTNKKSGVQKIIMQINQADYMPVMFQIFYTNDIQNIIYINTYKTKQQISDSSFVFDSKEYPNVELIDLR